MGSPFLVIDPIYPSIIFLSFSPILVDFDLPSVFHFNLDTLIMILIKF